MTIQKRDLASFDEANSQWKVDAGNYIFKIGDNVDNILCSASLKISEYTEKVSNVLPQNAQFNKVKQ